VSLVDAFVPAVVVAVLVCLSPPYWLTDAVNPVVLADRVAVGAFVGSLTVGAAASMPGYGLFPATKSAKWVWRASFRDFGRRRKR
jgi:hypothetical protein